MHDNNNNNNNNNTIWDVLFPFLIKYGTTPYLHVNIANTVLK